MTVSILVGSMSNLVRSDAISWIAQPIKVVNDVNDVSLTLLEPEIREIDLPAGTERTIAVRFKPVRGLNEVNTLTIETEWSIEVDEMGGWVLALTLHKEPPP